MEVLGFGGVMAVAIDDHDLASLKVFRSAMLRAGARLSNRGGFSIACSDDSQRRLGNG
jgi:hypothetical protein